MGGRHIRRGYPRKVVALLYCFFGLKCYVALCLLMDYRMVLFWLGILEWMSLQDGRIWEVCGGSLRFVSVCVRELLKSRSRFFPGVVDDGYVAERLYVILSRMRFTCGRWFEQGLDGISLMVRLGWIDEELMGREQGKVYEGMVLRAVEDKDGWRKDGVVVCRGRHNEG